MAIKYSSQEKELSLLKNYSAHPTKKSCSRLLVNKVKHF